MKRVSKPVFLILALAMLLVAFCITGCEKEPEIAWVEYGASHDIPCLQIQDAQIATRDDFRYILRKVNKIGVPEDWGYIEKKVKQENRPLENFYVGGEVYLTRYKDVTLQTYQDFVELLKAQQFQVVAQSSLQDVIYTTALTYQENSYTVSYFKKTSTIDVTASRENHLSPHLKQDNYSTSAQPLEGLSTTLTIRPMRGNATSYVIQLPNGHFIISGGGSMWDLSSTVEYLEANTPEGQTPVVEAWFICSGSYDLGNWVMGLSGLEENRILVNGVYFNQPGSDVIQNTLFEEEELDGETYYSRTSNTTHQQIVNNVGYLKTEDGKQTPIYRPMSGQKYYFNGGLTVEVPMTQEQMNPEDYEGEFKVASGSLLIRTEEKTFFDMGYLCKVNQERLVETYGEEYFADLDLVLAPYRGRRMYPEFQDVFCADYILFTNSKLHQLEPEYAAVRDYYAQNPDITMYSYSDGTFRYDFATGTAEIEANEHPQR